MILARLLAPILLLAIALPAAAEVTIDGPEKVPVYEFVRLAAKGDTAGAGFTWKVFDANRKKLSAKSIWKSEGKLVFVGAPGVYSVELMAYRFDPKTNQVIIDEAELEVTIVGSGPIPPGPTPPVPPVPPDDPLARAISSAYATETDPAKATNIKALAALYRKAPEFLDSPAATTAGGLLTVMRDAARAMLPATALPVVRRRIADEINAILPTAPDVTLTAEHKQAARLLFARLGVILEGVR